MGLENDAVQVIAEIISQAIDLKIQTAPYDVTLNGEIIGKEGTNKIIVKLHSAEYVITVGSNSYYSIGQIVKITIPQNDYSKMMVSTDDGGILLQQIQNVQKEMNTINEPKFYRSVITSTNGIYFKTGTTNTTLKVTIYSWDSDITSTIDGSNIIWKRISNDVASDTIWNNNHTTGSKELNITSVDMNGNTIFKIYITDMSVATSQISILESDSNTNLIGNISTNLPISQTYDNNSEIYNPDWSLSNMILTPTLYQIDNNIDLVQTSSITGVKWYNGSTLITNNNNYSLSGSKSEILLIKSNILTGLEDIILTCILTYFDGTTETQIPVSKTLYLSNTISNSILAISNTPLGNVFETTTTLLHGQCNLFRNSKKDITNVSYQWYQKDSSIETDQGGGLGWKKLYETENAYINVQSEIITIYKTAINNFSVFKCVIKDNDTTSETYNMYYEDFIYLYNQSNNIQVNIYSKNGNILENGIGQTTLIAKLFENGTEIDTDGTSYSYKWYKYNYDGTMDYNFGGAGIPYKLGKSLFINSDDINVISAFNVEIN